MIFEMVSESKFNAPNNFLHNFQAVNGNSIPNNKKQQEALSFLNLNVYSSTIYNEGIITPMTNQASKFYTFDLESVSDTSGLRIYKIRFMPKLWSQKLICGDLYIRDQSWIIDKIDVNGRFDFAESNLIMTFGREYRRGFGGFHYIKPACICATMSWEMPLPPATILLSNTKRWNGWKKITKGKEKDHWT